MRALGGLLAAALLIAGCAPKASEQAFTPAQLKITPWAAIEQRARDTEVAFGMWTGDEQRNRYFQTTVAPALREQYGIQLRIVPCADTVELINKLLNERAAGKTSNGSMDLIWINGENFRTAKQAQVLWGPFADSLPNTRFYDERARQRDFGTTIDGYEAPWQKAQFVLGYDSARTPQPPRSLDALRGWVKAHPGRFTYIAPPDFTGSAFIRHVLIRFGGGPDRFASFDEQTYRGASAKAIEYLNDIRPFLWRRGETYPGTLKELNRLFANQEVDFAMSYGPNFAAVAVERGEFPATSRTMVFDEGTIGNYNFLAIPFNTPHAEAALAVINHLMSFERLLDMSRVLGNPFPLKLDSLTLSQRELAGALPLHPASLPLAVLESHYMPEPDAMYLTRFEADWREKVLQK